MLGHVQKSQQQVFAAGTREEAAAILGDVVDRLRTPAPKVAGLIEAAEDDLLAFLTFPAEHRSKLRSTNPLERANREIARRSDVVGIYPNDASLIRLAGCLLIEAARAPPVGSLTQRSPKSRFASSSIRSRRV
jgi:putative transposase